MTSSGTAKPYVKCIGASSTGVTQSCYLVRFKKYAILLDCGGYQESDVATNYKKNLELLKKIRVKELDYIILSHTHYDHSGMIPALYAKGCQAHLIVPSGSTQFLLLMWEDSMRIMESDCAKLNNSGIKASPFYSQKDIEKTLDRIIEVEYSYGMGEGDISLYYFDAGHILNSKQILLTLTDGYVKHRLAFTGDIGGPKPQPFIEDHEPMPYTNILLAENTYNTPVRMNKPYDRDKDLDKIEAAVNGSNRILIPCFSLQRTQVILSVLYDMWKQYRLPGDVKIILDSPLAQKFCSIWPEFDEILGWGNLHQVQSWQESQALQAQHFPCIVIAASGMMNAGRSVSWAKALLPNPKNTILFCGFSSPNTVAYNIRYGDRYIELDGESVPNNANIVELVSFSSHANYEELMGYYAYDYAYDKIILVHGNMDGKVGFGHTLQDKLVEQGKSSRVICANQDTKVYF